jgi:cytochrome P450
LASLIPGIQPYIQRSTSLLSPGEEITFSDFSIKLFSDMIGQAAFGVDFGLTKHVVTDEAAADFIQKHLYSTTSLKMDLSGSLSMILGAFMPMLQEPLRQLLLRVPWSVDRRIDEASRALSGGMDGIVAERAAQADRGKKDFLSVLLNAIDRSDAMRKLFTPDYVSALTYEHLLAGSGTMSFTLSCLVYLVSMHPEVEEKLLLEVDAFGPNDLVPDAEDLCTKFPYVEQVFRLHSLQASVTSKLLANTSVPFYSIFLYIECFGKPIKVVNTSYKME